MKDDFPNDACLILYNTGFNEKIGYGILITILALLGAQILFFINVIYTFVKRKI